MSEALHRTLARALEAARESGCEQWVAWRRRRRDDADAAELLATATGDAFYYAIPEERFALAARDAVFAVEAEGEGRFEAVDRALEGASAHLFLLDEAEAGDLPLFVGGFAFAATASEDDAWRGFPAARWWLPRESLAERDGEAWRTSSRRVAPGDDLDALARDLRSPAPRPIPAPVPCAPAGKPSSRVTLDAQGDAEEHTRLVTRAREAIARGELEKVVVARALDVRRDAPFDPRALLEELRALHPRCASYAVGRAGAWLVGATPERLLRREGSRLRAMALAGSASRGRSPEEDARLRRELVESKKEQSEHAVAVRGLRAALEPVCAALRVPEAPATLALAGVRHLCTEIEGALEENAPGLVSLAGRVHPTAAVAGAPREASLAWLAEHEGLVRGWYAGLVGWRARDGDGELSAALRCALLRAGRARLFAGGGIVAGSDPAAELRETRLKWNALLPSLLEL